MSSTEAVVQMCYVKKVFLDISQNSQENTCVGTGEFVGIRLPFKSSPTEIFQKIYLLKDFFKFLLGICLTDVFFSKVTYLVPTVCF